MNGTATPSASQHTPAPVPSLHVSDASGVLRFVASGRWTVHQFARLDASVAALKIPVARARVANAEIDMTAVAALDTAGAMLIDRVRRELETGGIAVRIHGASEKQRVLLGVVRDNNSAARPAPPPPRNSVSLMSDAVNGAAEALGDAMRLTAFLGETALAAARTAMRPRRFRATSFVHHIEHIGLRAVPIISLICILIGAVITQQGIVQLRAFNVEPYAIDMLGMLALREVGILLTAIVVAGRSASAFTAEIGSMKMREEIDAMHTLGLNPMETLVLPRIAALLLVLPILAFIGDIMCLVGGAAMAMAYLDIDLAAYISRLHSAITLKHFLVGLVKAPLAALIIGLVGCLEGLRVRGSAESLGQHVTAAVVKAIFLVIIFDALFAMFLSACGY